jgi:hypothetical protein
MSMSTISISSIKTPGDEIVDLMACLILGKNSKLVPLVYLIYNLLPVISKQTQKFLWYVKKTI